MVIFGLGFEGLIGATAVCIKGMCGGPKMHYTYTCKSIRFVMLCACDPLKPIHISRKLVISIIIQAKWRVYINSAGYTSLKLNAASY